MTILEQGLFWVTVFAYVCGSLSLAYRFVFKRANGGVWEKFILYIGFLANVLTIFVRFVRGGHLFTGMIYEDSLVIAAMTLVIYFILQRKLSTVGPLGMILVTFSFLLMGLGHFYSKAIKPLKAAYLSQWMMVHGLFALLGVVCFVAAAGCAVFYLLKCRYPAGQEPPKYSSLPPVEVLSELIFRLVLFGFFAWTVMLLSGSIWAKDLYGSYWSWDPVETWSLVSWLAWGIFLHLGTTFRNKGKLLAWLCILSLFTSIISLWGVGLVTPRTFHNLQQLLY